jgi:mannose-1-phosphate guanylyltransferase
MLKCVKARWSEKNLKAIILVGGKATRLLPLTTNTPKSLVPVLNVPMLAHLINHLKEYDIRDIILAQGHLAGSIEEYFGDGSRLGVSITHSYENVPLGSAGAVKNAEKLLDSTFLVVNSDIFSDMDFTAMLDLHRTGKAKVTIAVTPVNDPTKYGLVEADNHGKVGRFLEKPKPEEVTTNMINAGAWFVEADVLSMVPPATNYSFERNIFPQLLALGKPVYAYSSTGYWIDMGTIESYLRLHRDLLEGKCRHYKVSSDEGIIASKDNRIPPTVKITGKILVAPGCTFGSHARITGPVVVGPGCTLDDDIRVENSVIWHDVRIMRGASILDSVIADNCLLGAGCIVENSVIGDHVSIGSDVSVPPGSKIEPGTKIENPKP